MPTAKTRQLPFDLGHQPGLDRENFVEAPENRPALELVERWPNWRTPLAIVIGPPGSGKTHLAAIFADRAEAFDAGSDMDAALAHAEAGGACVIGDADRKSLDEKALFHLINAARSGSGSLLLTARRPPTAWDIVLPDLLSRLKAGTLVEIGEPGETLLETVFVKLFADRQVEIEPSVAQFVVRRLNRSLEAVNAFVEKLDRAALAQRRPVTRALATDVLAQMGSAAG